MLDLFVIRCVVYCCVVFGAPHTYIAILEDAFEWYDNGTLRRHEQHQAIFARDV